MTGINENAERAAQEGTAIRKDVRGLRKRIIGISLSVIGLSFLIFLLYWFASGSETKWMEFTAPSASNEPLQFFEYEGWSYETRYASEEEGQREELVGAIESGGKWYFPGGVITIRSRDNQPLHGWIKFWPPD